MAVGLRRDAARLRSGDHQADGEQQLLHLDGGAARRIEALTGPQERCGRWWKRSAAAATLIVDGLNAIDGITCNLPKGAFYVFPNITGTGMSSRDFADYLLQEHGVAGIAGTSFGSYGEGYLRLFYANSDANLERASERVAAATAGAKAGIA